MFNFLRKFFSSKKQEKEQPAARYSSYGFIPVSPPPMRRATSKVNSIGIPNKNNNVYNDNDLMNPLNPVSPLYLHHNDCSSHKSSHSSHDHSTSHHDVGHHSDSSGYSDSSGGCGGGDCGGGDCGGGCD